MRILSPELEVRDLRLVLALAAAKTTTGAADVLGLTQSAVSRALAVAEGHAGVALFTRTPHGLVPTAAGERILEAAPGFLADLRALERSLREPVAAKRRVRFAAQCAMAYPWLTRVVERLRRVAPELELVMPTEHGQDTPQALAQGRLDAALLTSRAPSGFGSKELFADELVFLVAAEHRLARQGKVLPRDLREHLLLVPNAPGEDSWFVREVFAGRASGVRVQRFPVTEAIVEFARAGLGVGILSEWVAEVYLASSSDLCALRLHKGPLLRHWRLAYAQELAPCVEPLLEAILAARPPPAAPTSRGGRRPSARGG